MNIDRANIDRANIDRANIDRANTDRANTDRANTACGPESARTRAAADLVVAAGRGLVEAALATSADERYVAAHLAALRAAAAVLADRGRPNARRARLCSAWELLSRVAPELGEWAQYFAATARRRAGVEAGTVVVSPRAADDLLRDAEVFLARVCDLLGAPSQQVVRFAAPLAAVTEATATGGRLRPTG